ncbi:hypothetical protein Godav_010720 [Gossypium davidsonii]|uniref:Histone H4 n=2 Tax=Gossypium TaxID=3633 RepID=A0A7J8R7P2_GOSDV|nr:hypothetical protein [Gossypium davidsonii]MBA0644841.1 hypothetical protein [Gossypium klotzschianum]
MSGRGKGGKGLGKGGAKRHRKGRSEAYQRLNLRGNPWSSQDLLGERHSRCGHIHRTRQEKDGDCHGCGLCAEEAG